MLFRSPKKRATGSGATVIDPLESIIKDTYTCITLGDRNLPLKTFFEQVSQSNFAREIFDEVAPKQVATTVSKQELKRFLTENGLPEDAIPDSLLTVYRAKNMPLRDSQVGYFVDGKWKVAEMHNRELAQALRGLRPQEMNLLVKTMKVLADTLRLGVVLDPMYSIGNFFKDNLTAPFYVKGFVPFYSAFKVIGEMVAGSEDYQKFLRVGGGGGAGSPNILSRKYLQENLEDLLDKYPESGTIFAKSWNVITSPFDLLGAIVKKAEESTKFGAFKVEKANRPDTSGDLYASGFMARESTQDFQKTGSATKSYGQVTAFALARISGMDRFARAAIENPLRMMTVGLASITIPAIIGWLHNHNDERWLEMNPSQRDLNQVILIPGLAPLKIGRAHV